MFAPWKKSYDQPRQHIKRQRHYFANKDPYSQSYGFSSSHVWIWELDHKESWAPKNWCFWAVVLEKTLESPLDCKEIQPVNPKGNQSWISIGRTDAEAPILWPHDTKNWFFGKDPDAGKDWRQEEKGTTEGAAVHGVTKSRTRLSDWTELSVFADGKKSKEDFHCVYTWLAHFVVQQKLTQHSKAIIRQK